MEELLEKLGFITEHFGYTQLMTVAKERTKGNQSKSLLQAIYPSLTGEPTQAFCSSLLATNWSWSRRL